MKLNDVKFIGNDLNRPECVVTASNGRVYASDFRGGVMIIEPDGTQNLIKSREPSFALKPNGILLEKDGSFLIAHLGDDAGGVYRLFPDGRLDPVLLEVDNEKVPPANFVHRDRNGRLWITVSTRLQPRALGYRGDNRDGFIICIDDKGPRIAADNLGYTNECIVDPEGKYLYVNETFTKELSRFEISEQGSLVNKKVIFRFGDGEFPDGMTLDSEGGIWIVCIVSNRVIRINKNLESEVIIEESDEQKIGEIEAVYLEGKMDASHMKTLGGKVFRNISSIAFGGKDLKTIFLGCLLGESLPCFKSPYRGMPLPWWDYPGPAIPNKNY